METLTGKHPSEHCHHWTPLSWAEIKQEPGSGIVSDDPRWMMIGLFVCWFVVCYHHMRWGDDKPKSHMVP